MERTEREWPTILRHVVLGRVLGRALAHEIGHFLLRSRGHSQIGLMRANQSIADLCVSGTVPFLPVSGRSSAAGDGDVGCVRNAGLAMKELGLEPKRVLPRTGRD